MNSADEERLFLEWSWVKDDVLRQWLAPDGFVVTTDDLMVAADVLGPNVEWKLRAIIAEHGRRDNAMQSET